jgi:hypothetical protein
MATSTTWYDLITKLKDSTEPETLKMLEQEAKTTNRFLWKQRIYQRYSKLRREREHAKYLGAKKGR